ncbi:glycosyltransferase family 2 protein [Bifidobacterium callitrichos]|uniref:Glycosyltransferase family 2 protein n=1 Tax=Bifidobacterium callitrichos TaxID=762209 RepID=A0A5M9Z9W6_9BIFI|nr:glycosyltransferase family 2 protein [Bifidobacterium callitrichos]KAA8815143.1 glycosyltransferase family 2 protein [Bifidobacterium callitrichos]
MPTVKSVIKTILKNAPGKDLARHIAISQVSHSRTTHISNARELLQRFSPKPSYRYKKPTTLTPFAENYDVSVIVPAYNVESFIEECLTSLVEQQSNYSFEIIVVNDGSTDETPDIINSIADQHSNVHAINQHNKGFSGARNTGINNAKGKSIMFVDSDDKVAPGHIESFASSLFNSEYDFITGRYTIINESGNYLSKGEKPRSMGAPWGRIYRRKVWDNIRFPEGYLFEDTIQNFCIKPLFTELDIDDTSYMYRSRATSISHSISRNRRSVETYWIIEELIEECRLLGVPFDQYLYARTIKQFGAVAYRRILALNNEIQHIFFAACSEFLVSIPEFKSFWYTQDEVLGDIEKALLRCNFNMWRTACQFAQIY